MSAPVELWLAVVGGVLVATAAGALGVLLATLLERYLRQREGEGG